MQNQFKIIHNNTFLGGLIYLFFLFNYNLNASIPFESIDKPEYYKYTASLPDHPIGYWIVPKSYLKDLDPSENPFLSKNPKISVISIPGEIESSTFVIYATENLSNIKISTTDLYGTEDTISANHLEIHTVMRAPQRKHNHSSAEEFVITNRFLPEFEAFDLLDQHLREIWIFIRIPKNTRAGTYSGIINVSSDKSKNQNLPISVEILPISLEIPTSKQYGVYHYTYDRNGPKSGNVILKELQDIRSHYGTITISAGYPKKLIADSNLVAGMWIDYKKIENNYIPNYGRIKNYLNLLREAGFSNCEVIINTGFEWLASDITNIHPEDNESYNDKKEAYQKLANEISKISYILSPIAKKALNGLLKLQVKYSEYTFVLTHMDEVFNRGRLPLYIALSELVRKYSDFPLYITFQSGAHINESMRYKLDPYVDIRGHHGYTFEHWLSRGHTIEEYYRELQLSGDIAFHYHNQICWFINPKWQRLINGLYMWVAPFKTRVDWAYNWYQDNPLNDLDGSGQDWIYAGPLQ